MSKRTLAPSPTEKLFQLRMARAEDWVTVRLVGEAAPTVALPAATSPPVGRAWDRAGAATSRASMDTPIQPECFLSP